MDRVPVTSSNLVSVGHDGSDLEVEFHGKNGNSVYRHKDVPKELHDGLMAADSKGQYYNAHIKGKYGFSKVS